MVNNNKISKTTIVFNDGSPYWTCQQLLQLTTSGKLYSHCGGGDSLYGTVSIYEIDLNANTSKAVYKCTSRGGTTPTTTCE